MKKKSGLVRLLLGSILLSGLLFCGCGAKKEQEPLPDGQKETVLSESEVKRLPLEDGIYTVEVKTDSSMFRANEANDGKGILTVTDGQGVVHVSLASKNIVNLYPGTAEEAKMDEAGWLFPTLDEVTYPDGLSEEVYGFDLPVPVLGEEFDVAVIGKKEKWYDHKVMAEHPLKTESLSVSQNPEFSEKTADVFQENGLLADGSYTCAVIMQGGSGRASLQSPAEISVENGEMTAELVWSSPYYEFMLVDGVQYDPVKMETDGQGGKPSVSVFEIPVVLNQEMKISASTIAMSEPHLVEYTLYVDGDTLKEAVQEK